MLSAPAPVSGIDRSACPARRHGTASAAKNYRCACPDARAARYRADKRRHAGLPTDPFIPAIGSHRRIRGLQACGWTFDEISAEAGWSERSTVVTILSQQRVRASTAHRVRVAYCRMTAWPDPVGVYRDRSRRAAAAKGWARPQEWLPDELDDPHAVPDSVFRRPVGIEVPTADLLELRDAGLDYAAIAARVGSSAERVEARLTTGGRPGALPEDAVYAIRGEYLATRGRGWSGKAAAARYGCSPTTVSHVLQGKTHTHLGLTDLTATISAAASPAGSTTRKENAA